MMDMYVGAVLNIAGDLLFDLRFSGYWKTSKHQHTEEEWRWLRESNTDKT